MSRNTIILTSNAYLPNIGGIENSLMQLSKAYHEMGFRVVIIVSNVNTVNKQTLPLCETTEYATIWRYDVCFHGQQHSKLKASLLGWQNMRRCFRAARVEFGNALVISRYHITTIHARLAGFSRVSYLLPGVVKFQNQPSNTHKVEGLRQVKQWLVLFYHHAIQKLALQVTEKNFVFSSNMLNQLAQIGFDCSKVTMVSPGVDTNKFLSLDVNAQTALKGKLGLPLDKNLLLVVGRFTAAKGVEYAIRAQKELLHTHLVLVGGGELEDYYKSLVVKLGIEECVTFVGAVSDTSPFYQVASLFLMTSTYEPFGQTILEALSCEVPVIAFRAGETVKTATCEMLGDDACFYVNTLDASDLAKTISCALADVEKRAQISRNGVAFVRQKYSWNALAKSLIK